LTKTDLLFGLEQQEEFANSAVREKIYAFTLPVSKVENAQPMLSDKLVLKSRRQEQKYVVYYGWKWNIQI
jgi:hypothetical protein